MKVFELLTEHVINAISKEQKIELIDDVWDLIENTYKSIGRNIEGFSKDNLVSTPGIWKLIKKSGKLVAGVLYKDRNGRKIRLVFQNGTPEGKLELKKLLSDDIKLERAWVEVSGPLEKVLINLGMKHIPSDKAEKLLGQKISKYHDDGYHYEREVLPGKIKTQSIMGFIK